MAAGLVLGALTGCTPPAAPQPTPTFAGEEEAFAAAEATYRAYVDALNAVDLSDPETFEDVYAWTTGDANAGARETFTQMHADKWVVDGPTEVSLLTPSAAQPEDGGISLDVCLDVSEVTLVDESGASVVAPDRRDIQSMVVTVRSVGTTPTGLAISSITGREGEPSCVG